MSKTKERQWFRTGAEAGAIVASILIAFAIDAWWEKRGNDQWQSAQLLALREEYSANLTALDWVVRMDNYTADNVESILADLQAETPGDRVEIENTRLGSIVAWRTSDISTGTLDALLASGRLGDIENAEIRQVLAEWPSNVLDVQEDENLARDFVAYVVVPGLLGQGILTPAYEYRPRGAYREQANERANEPAEKTDVAITPELLELAAVRISHARFAGRSVERLQNKIRRILELIDAELATG